MTITKLYLIISVLIWLPYGLFCAIDPGYLEGAAGVLAATPTGTTELRAMYGGLQASIGVMCAAALIRSDLARSAVLAVAFLTTGLFIVRVCGFFMDGSASDYTNGVLVFEGSYSLISILLLRKSASN